MMVLARTLAALLAVSSAVSSPSVAVLVNEHPDDPVQAATELLQRVLPKAAAAQFELSLMPPQPDGAATMELGTKDGKVHLRGSGAVELASALNWYLNDYLNVTYDWSTYAEGQLPMPAALAVPRNHYNSSTGRDINALQLPLPSRRRAKVRTVPHSYYMNVCTHGYSLAFAPWEYWSQHIDWAAMHGITTPLAFVGQEYVWMQLFESYNLSLADQQGFYSGPAFLPWQRMGNMRGFGGPLTVSWMHQRKELNLKMLARMRGLGMKPALPAFSGHVPRNFTKLFPLANFSRSPDWSDFSGSDSVTRAFADVSLLDTTDPLFVTLGAKFIALSTAVFGTDHLYQTDTFNEMEPPTNDTGYLARSSRNTFAAMAAADPDAVWLMQAWLFTDASFWGAREIEAYLSGVAREKLWLLDLSGDSRPFWSQTQSFFGHPFILCTLLNFGGQQGLNGNINRMKLGYQAALGVQQPSSGHNNNSSNVSSIVGVGLTMEGIWQNCKYTTYIDSYLAILTPQVMVILSRLSF